jgi:hypothetical protein
MLLNPVKVQFATLSKTRKVIKGRSLIRKGKRLKTEIPPKYLRHLSNINPLPNPPNIILQLLPNLRIPLRNIILLNGIGNILLVPKINNSSLFSLISLVGHLLLYVFCEDGLVFPLVEDRVEEGQGLG